MEVSQVMSQTIGCITHQYRLCTIEIDNFSQSLLLHTI